MNKVQAKMSFYHDMTGSRAHGEVFEVDSATLTTLEQAGYVQRMDSQASSQMGEEIQKIAQRQEVMGRQQEKANLSASLAAHIQNEQANQHTQQVNQELQQQAQQRGEGFTNEADQKAMKASIGQFQPTAMPNVEANPVSQQTNKAQARKADK